MPIAITVSDLLRFSEPPVLMDARKSPARAASGLTIPDALRGEPDRVAVWGPALAGRTAVVFCVHGHEVSQGVADALCGLGVAAVYLDGGFEAWHAAGNPVAAIGAES